jgi:hypothetical protein
MIYILLLMFYNQEIRKKKGVNCVNWNSYSVKLYV